MEHGIEEAVGKYADDGLLQHSRVGQPYTKKVFVRREPYGFRDREVVNSYAVCLLLCIANLFLEPTLMT